MGEEDTLNRFTLIERNVFNLQSDIKRYYLNADLAEKAMARAETKSDESLKKLRDLKDSIDKIIVDFDEIKKNPPSKYNRIAAILLGIFVIMNGLAMFYSIFLNPLLNN
jgi:hypothetical protein